MRDTPDASSASPQGNRPPSAHNSPRTAISLTVHGVRHHVDVEDRWTLVELLRDHLDLTGTKLGCDRSECGACTVFVGVTDVGPGAKTTMGMIATEALGVPLSQVTVVSGDTECCPYSVGESGSRTTIMTGMAVVEAVKDVQQQIAARGMPTGNDVLVATATPTPVPDGTMRQCFGAHFVEVEPASVCRRCP